MSRHAAIPLLAAALGGLALLATGPAPEADPVTPSAAPALPEGTYLSHDWYEPPPREARRSLLPAGQNPNLVCTLPNCRNCQIHATWKQAL
jgi:hypothetical protein